MMTQLPHRYHTIREQVKRELIEGLYGLEENPDIIKSLRAAVPLPKMTNDQKEEIFDLECEFGALHAYRWKIADAETRPSPSVNANEDENLLDHLERAKDELMQNYKKVGDEKWAKERVMIVQGLVDTYIKIGGPEIEPLGHPPLR